MERTDLSGWRLVVAEGHQTWHYLESPEQRAVWPQTSVERHHLLLEDEPDSFDPKPTTLHGYIQRAMHHAISTQTKDGHWAGEFSGPLFLTPGWIFSCFITGALNSISPPMAVEIRRYIFHYINNDGGWGLYINGPSTMLCTALNYVALRILGVPSSNPFLMKARAWIHNQGGILKTPSWGKFWLAVLNIFSWEGVTPMLPEIWLLPNAFPVHAGQFWCHTRLVFLGMSYVYGAKISVAEDSFIRSLRKELFTEPFESINWAAVRYDCAASDTFVPMTTFAKMLFGSFSMYESNYVESLRQTALDVVADHIRAGDEASDCLSIGAVSKSVNMIVAWHLDGPSSKYFNKHVKRCANYAWMGPEGMRMNGTDGAQLWDTALITQALLAAGEINQDLKMDEALQKAFCFIQRSQIQEEVREVDKYYRHMTKGGFPFSTSHCGWGSSDCTAEALRAVLAMHRIDSRTRTILQDEALFAGINQMLSYQNKDGGFGSYEITRGPRWLEWLNPVQVFGDIMIDYSYAEITSQVLQTLHAFQKLFPSHRAEEIRHSFCRGIDFIKQQQQPDGSWCGSWGVCFSYGTRLGLEALALNGEFYNNSDFVRRACDYLVGYQMKDGGWSETLASSTDRQWRVDNKSNATQTAWVVLGLLAAKYPHVSKLESAIRLLCKTQLSNGHWPNQQLTGVFNKSCLISYSNYQDIFPMWALSRFASSYPDKNITFD